MAKLRSHQCLLLSRSICLNNRAKEAEMKVEGAVAAIFLSYLFGLANLAGTMPFRSQTFHFVTRLKIHYCGTQHLHFSFSEKKKKVIIFFRQKHDYATGVDAPIGKMVKTACVRLTEQ